MSRTTHSRGPSTSKGCRRFRKAMEREGLDLLLAFGTESEPAFVRYLSGYWPNFETAAVMIPRAGDPVLITGTGERPVRSTLQSA